MPPTRARMLLTRVRRTSCANSPQRRSIQSWTASSCPVGPGSSVSSFTNSNTNSTSTGRFFADSMASIRPASTAAIAACTLPCLNIGCANCISRMQPEAPHRHGARIPVPADKKAYPHYAIWAVPPDQVSTGTISGGTGSGAQISEPHDWPPQTVQECTRRHRPPAGRLHRLDLERVFTAGHDQSPSRQNNAPRVVHAVFDGDNRCLMDLDR